MRLNNKIALITGASAGIGRASAALRRRRGEAGAQRTAAGAAAGAEIRAAGGEAVAHAADVADPGTAQALVDLAQQSFGAWTSRSTMPACSGRACRQRSSGGRLA